MTSLKSGTKPRYQHGPIAFALSAVAALIMSSLIFLAGPAQAAEVDDEAAFITHINELRASQGLGQLTIDTELNSASRIWANQIRADGVLSHAPDLSVGMTADWAKLGENVGVANTDQLEELFDAFVNSPGHYANLVDPSFTHIGTAVVYDETGRMWTAHRFMAITSPAPTTTLIESTSTTITNSAPQTTAPTSSIPPTTVTPPSSTTTTTINLDANSDRPRLGEITIEGVDTKVLAELFTLMAASSS